MIESGLQQDLDAAALAMRIGVSERHLRRVFAAEFGVSPAAYLASRRLQLGRRLLRESAMSVLDVALTTGFRSLRTFNVRYRSAYGEAPRSARGARRAVAEATLDLPLAYRPPLDWDAMLAFLGGRAIPGVELVSATGTYRRTVRMTTGASELLGWVEVSKSVRGDALVARISASLARVVPQLTAGLRRPFDLSCDPAQVNTVLGVLAQRRPGLRVPGALDGSRWRCAPSSASRFRWPRRELSRTLRGALRLAGGHALAGARCVFRHPWRLRPAPRRRSASWGSSAAGPARSSRLPLRSPSRAFDFRPGPTWPTRGRAC